MSEKNEYDPTEPPPFISEGVRLLLQRMESHPDEFDLDHGKWAIVLNVIYTRASGRTPAHRAEPWLSTAEVNAVWEKYVEIKQKNFHNDVMKKLLDEEDHALDAYAISQGKRAHLAQNAIQPGSWQNVAAQTSNTPTPTVSLENAMKILGIK